MISGIKDNKKEWKCKVRVVEKRNIRDSRTSPNKYRPCVLQDEEVTKVLALANSGAIQQIDKILDLKNTYYISNAAVMPSMYGGDSPSVDYKFIWMLSRKTWIEVVPKSEEIQATNESDTIFTRFYDFYDLCGSRTPINFMAVAIQRMPREYVSVGGDAKTAHDFMLVNEDMEPILLTVWEDFAINQGREITSLLESGRHPLILGKRVTVTPFNGVSLSTRYDSLLEVNPSDPICEQLKKWRDESLELIESYIETKAYKNALISLAYPPGRPKVRIADISKSNSTGKGYGLQLISKSLIMRPSTILDVIIAIGKLQHQE